MVASHAVRHFLPATGRLPWLLPELRARAGLTQPQLADRLGASLPTVQRLESGAHPATMKRTWQLADALGLSAVELMALIDAAEELGESGEVPGWLDGLSWIPSPGGPLQRPVLVVESGPSARPLAWEPAPSDADPDLLLLGRVRVLGLLLGQLRERVHLPVADLATLWGPSASTIKRFERGKGSPDLGELGELALLLGLTRTELVALAEGLLLHLDGQVPRRKRPELLVVVREWLESFRWLPNPGQGLLASRPAGHRWRPAKADERSMDTLMVGDVPAACRPAKEEPAAGSRWALAQAELARPAAMALAEPLLRGWSVVGATLPPVHLEKKSLSAVVAAELMRALERRGWPVGPALLVRPGRARARPAGSWAKRPARVSTVSPAEAQLELVRGSPVGPWRLVIVEGLGTLDEAGLGRRQPAPQLQGAALAVLEVDPVRQKGDLSHVLGRGVDFVYTAVSAMDAGLLPGLRFHGALDPVEQEGSVGFGGWKLPTGPELCDDRRLEALADAGAFAKGRCTLIHVAGDEQEAWVRGWVERRLGARGRQVRLALRSSAKLRFDRPLDEVVLVAAEYPAVLVRQAFAALRRADVEAGLDLWTMQAKGDGERKRRGTLAAALGVAASPSWRVSESSWRSPKGSCTFDWVEPPGPPRGLRS